MNQGKLSIAASEAFLRYQHPFAAFVGMYRAERNTIIQNRHFRARLRPA